MAARGRILAAVLFSCAVLPLVSSAFLPIPTGTRDPVPEIPVVGHPSNPGLDDPIPDFPGDGDNGRGERDGSFTVPGEGENPKFGNEAKPMPELILKPVPEVPVVNPEPKPEPIPKPVPEVPVVNPEPKPVPEVPVVTPEPKPDPILKPVPEVPVVTPEPKPVPDVPVVKPAPVKAGLREGFYQESCPQAEEIVKEAVDKILERQAFIGPAFVRLFFHDCFVTGCDASVLLEKTPSGEEVENKASQNGFTLRGALELEEIKTQVEAACPGVVSCADIIAFATRDALNQTGVPRYNVAGGRRDRPASLKTLAEANLPLPTTPVPDIIKMFEQKGMTLDDLIVLLGAHSIGEAHCSVVVARFWDNNKRDQVDASYRDENTFLTMCGFNPNNNQTIAFDQTSPHMMDSLFYQQLLNKKALIESDGNLAIDPRGGALMKRYAVDPEGWMKKFAQAMIKLGELEVLTGDQGEIRKECKSYN